MAGLLVGVCLALLIVTALGITGLASFWVAQRRKQIGIRRALGATRGDILRYFQSENFLIVTFGIALGIVLAFAINTTLEFLRTGTPAVLLSANRGGCLVVSGADRDPGPCAACLQRPADGGDAQRMKLVGARSRPMLAKLRCPMLCARALPEAAAAD